MCPYRLAVFLLKDSMISKQFLLCKCKKGLVIIDKKIYKVGIYVRLSKENAKDEESLSIENQKFILTKHVRDNGWDLVEICNVCLRNKSRTIKKHCNHAGLRRYAPSEKSTYKPKI